MPGPAIATAATAATAETRGSQLPLPAAADVLEELGGVGILGSVGQGGQIEGRVAISGLVEGHGVNRVDLRLKEVIESGWERITVPLTEKETERLNGAVLDHVLVRDVGRKATSEEGQTGDVELSFAVEGVFYSGRLSDLVGVQPIADA